MTASIFAFGIALLLFGLSNEAETTWLQITGIVTAVYFVIAGAYTGWQTARKE
jgi:hypothetical protein